MSLKPRFAANPGVRLLDLKSSSKPFFIVASVEVGNTTTKCILTATNMDEGKTYHVTKTVKMTRDVRPPKANETVFGKTLNGVELTRESVSELVSGTLLEAVKDAHLDIETDINFVVRSTGVVAGFDAPEEVGEFIKALADGCLTAGVPPKHMTPPMSVDNLPEKFQKHSKLDKVFFDGAVASVLPPTGATGVEIVANEMEGELATAGIKEGAKWVDVDFRNPCMSMDFGTTLDGRIISPDKPYAKTIGNFCGYAGAIPDALIKGTETVDSRLGTALDVFNDIHTDRLTMLLKGKNIKEYAKKVLDYVIIEKVPESRDKYGSVPVNPKAAKDIGVVLIGCDVGDNGSDMDKLSMLGGEIYSKYGLKVLFAVIDEVMAQVIYRLVKVAKEEGLVYPETAIGITGRAGISGDKAKLALKYLEELGLNSKIEENVVFVDDGLARGAAVMARCMNSLGTTFNPLGGHRGGKCILGQRIKLQNK
ncbi:putative methanogenesis marker protein 14 [Methanococcoides vulcani]|uniref:Putative methanogenesis marker protein 14 n=1 Tax=Methanococcoides vulcani TaxID=1353158 RepID=A0A1I0ASF0_9EURY|nr:methanogenesis marker 14 protein [Methanococcoides vulcani]SES96853.1 putative methanogenesis marker protein 14 [Methanococcoides vulcani]